MSRHENPAAPAALGSRMRTALTGTRTRAVLSLGIVLGLGAVGTLAAWSDTATATSGVFSTGSIKLKLADQDGPKANYAFTTLTKADMMPGTTVAAVLPVSNTGSGDFKYTMGAVATTSDLAPYLKVTVSTGTSNGTVCSGGTVIANNLALTSGGTTALIGTGRSLLKNASENLCFQVTLDAAAPPNVQNQTVNTSFNFNATSV